MTAQERMTLMAKLTQIIQGESMRDDTNGKVNAVPQDEQLLAEELGAIQAIFTALDPLSAEARSRCIGYIVNFFTEQEQRERRSSRDFMAPSGGEARAYAQTAESERR